MTSGTPPGPTSSKVPLFTHFGEQALGVTLGRFWSLWADQGSTLESFLANFLPKKRSKTVYQNSTRFQSPFLTFFIKIEEGGPRVWLGIYRSKRMSAISRDFSFGHRFFTNLGCPNHLKWEPGAQKRGTWTPLWHHWERSENRGPYFFEKWGFTSTKTLV